MPTWAALKKVHHPRVAHRTLSTVANICVSFEHMKSALKPTYTSSQALLNDLVQANECAAKNEQNICGIYLIHLTFGYLHKEIRCEHRRDGAQGANIRPGLPGKDWFRPFPPLLGPTISSPPEELSTPLACTDT